MRLRDEVPELDGAEGHRGGPPRGKHRGPPGGRDARGRRGDGAVETLGGSYILRTVRPRLRLAQAVHNVIFLLTDDNNNSIELVDWSAPLVDHGDTFQRTSTERRVRVV